MAVNLNAVKQKLLQIQTSIEKEMPKIKKMETAASNPKRDPQQVYSIKSDHHDLWYGTFDDCKDEIKTTITSVNELGHWAERNAFPGNPTTGMKEEIFSYDNRIFTARVTAAYFIYDRERTEAELSAIFNDPDMKEQVAAFYEQIGDYKPTQDSKTPLADLVRDTPHTLMGGPRLRKEGSRDPAEEPPCLCRGVDESGGACRSAQQDCRRDVQECQCREVVLTQNPRPTRGFITSSSADSLSETFRTMALPHSRP